MRTGFSLKGVDFESRVFVASGTFGYGDELREVVNLNKLGGIFTKSLSWKPRDGNPPRRIVETPSGMLNSIGLANIGVHDFVEKRLPFLRSLKTRIMANIAASSIQEYGDVLSLLEDHEGIHGYEINVSCPNVKEGGLSFGTDCGMTAKITAEMRRRTKKPLIIKLTPNVTHIADFARAVKEEGADAVSVINTVIGMAVDVKSRKPKLSTVTGGLSGPAIKPIALAKVFEVAKAVDIPIFGIGGITRMEDAVEFLLVGAVAVQIGTANFVDPTTGTSIADQLELYGKQQKLTDLVELVGSLVVDKKASVLQSWL